MSWVRPEKPKIKRSVAMKKSLLCVTVLSLLISTAALAEETKKNEMPGMGMPHGMGMGMPMSGMGMKNCNMMGAAQMVATDEGGVFVLAGDKLMKYDADLNMVKEIEVKMPMPMGGKQCPMMGKMADQVPTGSQEKKS
jgi:hypothetical protein